MTRQEVKRDTAWVWRTGAAALAVLAMFFLAPLLMMGEEGSESDGRTLCAPTESGGGDTVSDGGDTVSDGGAVAPIPGWDRAQTVRVLKSDGRVERMTLEEYLWGVTAAEMPASFHPEALKAQAVCARTYCVCRKNAPDKHPGADVCTDFACCQAWLSREQAGESWGEEAARWGDKISAAVRDTDGLLCLYEGEPIDAVFFSSSAGRTEDAAEVWGRAVPYLTSVDSPEGEEVPGWQTVVRFTPEEFARRFRESCPQADFSAPVSEWIGEAEYDGAGGVKRLRIGGTEVTGGEARAVLGLRSTHFTVQAEREAITFRVTGYGHGVGLSQYGANALAGEGKRFDEILKWYYTGVSVEGRSARELGPE